MPDIKHPRPEAIIEGGTGGAHLAEVNVELLEGERRKVSSTELVNRWRQAVGDIPGVSSLTFTSSLFTTGEAINIELTHHTFETLLLITNRMKELLAQYQGVSDITDDFEPGKTELKLTLKEQGRLLGVTLSDLARQIRYGFYGQEVQRFQRGREDIRVMVRYPEAQRRSLADINGLRLHLAQGRKVPLSQVANIREGRGYAAINRLDRHRVVTITADVDEAVGNANEINQDLLSRVLPQMQNEFPGLTFSFGGRQKEQAESFAGLRLNFIIALLAIFALLAVQFRSYIQPAIVMSAIPFGLVGAVIGHILMGFNLSLLSLFGLVALAGIVVNDSLILIDLINRERKEGVPLKKVVIDSTARRFRPIILTTLTTFFGLTPMIMEKSLQAGFLIPMAVSLGFGVMFATAITLLLVPSLYLILEDMRAMNEKIITKVKIFLRAS